MAIASVQDYRAFLEADRVQLGREHWNFRAMLLDDVWRYQRLLRRVEYLGNCQGNAVLRLWASWRFNRVGTRLGFSIAPNTFGPGLSIAHVGTIVVNHGARIGARCRLHVDVNIGTTAFAHDEAPIIGDDAYIAPGAKLFGPIVIGHRVRIGANAVVTRSFPGDDLTLLGVPARAR